MAKYFIRKRFDSLIKSKTAAPAIAKTIDNLPVEELETVKPAELETSVSYLIMNTQVQAAYEELAVAAPDPVVAEPVLVCETPAVIAPDLISVEEKSIVSEVDVTIEDTIAEPVVSVDNSETVVSTDIVLEKNVEKQVKVKNKNKKNQTDK
jgi:hypothetical protein